MSKTIKKEIQIPKTSKSTEELLKDAKLEKKPEEPKKRGRGRPKGSTKKKKPTWSKTKYSQNLIAKAINKFLLGFTNRFIKENPLKEEECEIGEALVYTIDYYGLTLDHPLMVLIFASGVFTLNVLEHKAKIPKKMREEAKVPKGAKGQVLKNERLTG